MTETPNHSVHLQTLGNALFEIAVTEVVISAEQMILTIQLSYKNWRRAFREGLFHLDDESEPPDFETDRPVSLTLRLRPAVLRLISDPEEAVATLADPKSPLNHTEAWLATEIVQEVEVPAGSGDGDTFLQTGTRTRWAEPFFPVEERLATVIDALAAFLDDKAWAFTRVEEDVLRFGVTVDEERRWVVVALANEDAGTCTLLSTFSSQVPSANLADAALWMAKANYDLAVGCFEMDTDGEVRFRTTFPALHRSQVEAGVNDNLSIMADNFDAIAAFMN